MNEKRNSQTEYGIEQAMQAKPMISLTGCNEKKFQVTMLE